MYDEIGYVTNAFSEPPIDISVPSSILGVSQLGWSTL